MKSEMNLIDCRQDIQYSGLDFMSNFEVFVDMVDVDITVKISQFQHQSVLQVGFNLALDVHSGVHMMDIQFLNIGDQMF